MMRILSTVAALVFAAGSAFAQAPAAKPVAAKQTARTTSAGKRGPR